jgi:hypothetical protein
MRMNAYCHRLLILSLVDDGRPAVADLGKQLMVDDVTFNRRDSSPQMLPVEVYRQ